MKRILPVLLFLLCSLPAAAQTATITGNLNDIGAADATGPGSYVEFELRGFGSNQPKVNGVTVINITKKRFTPDSNGDISGTLYRNDNITPAGATFYRACTFDGGRLFRCADYRIEASSFDLTTATPISTTPVVDAPTGDNTYQRLDGANSATGSYVPSADSTVNLGSASFRWANIHSAIGSFGGLVLQGNSFLCGANTNCSFSHSSTGASTTPTMSFVGMTGTVAGAGGHLAFTGGTGRTSSAGGHVSCTGGATDGAGAGGNCKLGGGDSTSGTDGFVEVTFGHLKWTTDNAYDIGASGATRPRDLFLGRDASVRRVKANVGTTLVAGDFAVHANWGASASATFVSGTDSGFHVSIHSGASGTGANPTLILPFKDGTWTNSPICVATRGDSGDPPVGNLWEIAGITATQLTLLFRETPATDSDYSVYVICVGR